MARGGSQYAIPDENSARSAARLYEQYRVQLDTSRTRQQAQGNRVIDVRPSRVAIEQDSAAATRRPQPADRATQSQAAARSTDEATVASRHARRTGQTSDESAANAKRQTPAENSGLAAQHGPAAKEAEPTAAPYAYEPSALKTGVDLKSSPQARGVFVDLMA